MLCSTCLEAASSALGTSGKQDLFDTCHPSSQEALHCNDKRLSSCNLNRGRMACPVQRPHSDLTEVFHTGLGVGGAAWLQPTSLQAVGPALGSVGPELLAALLA